jgi:ABC-2 type transport system permease protein
MTLVLVRKLLRDVRLPLLVVGLLLFGFSLLWVKAAQRVTTEIAPFFNGLATVSKINPKLFEKVMFKGPAKVSQSVMGGADVRFERPSDFLAVELLHPVILIVATVWAVGRAAGAVAGELERGTMELLLSQPIPRHRLILAHLIVDAVVIPILCFSLWAGTRAGLAAVGPFAVDYTILDELAQETGGFRFPRGPDTLVVDVSGQTAAVAQVGALVFALSGLTLAISACSRSRWRAVGLATLVTLGMFSVNVLGQLWDAAAGLRPLTLFFYYQPQKVWLKGEWLVPFADSWPITGGVPGAAVLGAVGLIGYVVAWRVFDRRDLPAPL